MKDRSTLSGVKLRFPVDSIGKKAEQLINIREYLMVITPSACRKEVCNKKSIQKKGQIHHSREHKC